MPLAAGTRLGTYDIVGPLGAGGMGEVYRARDTRLGREIALKVLPEEFARDADRLARFEREARTVAGLNHPNIVTLFSVEDEDGVRFLTMELVEGRSLDQLVTPGGLPVARVLELGLALAEALVTAHEKGVVHRDLKPANVMVTGEGRVKVLDFGLAKVVASEPRPNASPSMTTGTPPSMAEGPLSTVGQVVGTVPYMAPEQVCGQEVDARTDLFALGIMLYELLSGRRPFVGPSQAHVSSAILLETPAPVRTAGGDLPPGLERIIGRCLEKDPRDRFQTARDAHDALRVEWREMERGAPPSGPLPEVARPEMSAGPAAPVSSPPPPTSRPSSAPRRDVPSIAVLPFVNRSRDQEDEYFSDGLADELINMLAKIRGLRVAARSSAFTFKGRQVTVAEVGTALGVATVLEGSVRKSGNRVRTSVQLVRVSDGDHLWSETYDRTLEDIFAVQDDIAHSVVKELRTTLLGERAGSQVSGEVRAEVAKAAKGRGTDAEAQRLYLQARHFIDRNTSEGVEGGIRHLAEALQRDPGFALAWAELGRAYSRQSDLGQVPAAEGYARARKAVEHALSLEPDLAEAHAQMGWIKMTYDWDWHGADASYARALELAPGNALVLRGAGVMAVTMGRREKAIEFCRQSLEQDRLSSANYGNLCNLGDALRRADRHAEAEAAYRKALELAPHRIVAHSSLALLCLAQGRAEEALAEAMREPDEAFRLFALSIAHHAAGRGPESRAALRELIEKHATDSAFQIAEVHAACGGTDAAFEWLERAYAQRDPGLSETRTNPQFRSLHGDPRWSAFLAKMGFAD